MSGSLSTTTTPRSSPILHRLQSAQSGPPSSPLQGSPEDANILPAERQKTSFNRSKSAPESGSLRCSPYYFTKLLLIGYRQQDETTIAVYLMAGALRLWRSLIYFTSVSYKKKRICLENVTFFRAC